MKRKNQIWWGLMMSLLLCNSCQKTAVQKPVFELLKKSHTNIDFINTIQEDEDFNMYAFMNIYTGGGVAIGDINNDGLEDVFFSGNRVSSKLYLNKGNLQFEDITESAGLTTNRWCAGASMVDINNDGWLDIYISVSGIGSDEKRSNLLFENQGDGSFLEKAEIYGLADSRQVMHASFFDYDNDGDLDVYMIVNPVNYSLSDVNNIRPKLENGESESTDRLYRNDENVFTDVSTEAGILIEGYSLGVSTCDINGDGWQDIYVSNDFLTNDIFYINNQDGTFSDQASTLLDHTSFAGMGNDISDFNNDGLPDIMVVDMLPEDHERRQAIIPASSYDKFEMTQKMNYQAQYTRNTLQLNNGNGTFSEIGQLSGIDKTDWSWSSLFADFDNDGDKDLFVTNGFLRDVGNLDYISYQRKNNAAPFGKKGTTHKKRLEAIQDLGAAKVQNYVFENNNDLTFNKRSDDWGITQKSCSNGAAFADLDNDGDLEMIINNVNDPAFIYENKTNENRSNHFLKIKLKGSEKNPLGIGTKINIENKDDEQFYQHNIYRGYESSMSQEIHFGLGENKMIELLEITWSDGNIEQLNNVSSDQMITLDYKHSKSPQNEIVTSSEQLIFTETSSLGLDYLHQENDYVDFKVQPLLPHKHSQNGPGIAVGDVNGDNLEDCYVGGSGAYAGQLFIQQKDGTFKKSTQEFDPVYEDVGTLLFDVEGDGDLDLYIVSGGTSFPANSNRLQDRLYENDGLGNFTKNENALPEMYSSGAGVQAADFDKDGDLDLFIGGRIVPGAYPIPAQSYLLRNDTKNGRIRFTDISNEFLPKKGKLGLVSTALWTDVDNDDWIDLMILGEWMPIQIVKNKKGKMDSSKPIEIAHSTGWWNSVVGGDFDQDGDIDYIAGNLGLNARFKATPEKPVCVYANDYDKNGRIDPVICQYIGDENYITHPRDLLIQQINAMRIRFRTYAAYAKSPFYKSFTDEEKEEALVLKSERFENSYLENLGDGNFKIHDLPMAAQTAPLYGMTVDDFDEDGHLDVLLVGNSFSTEVALGRYDAFEGLLLKGNGKGDFESMDNRQTGFFIDTDAKGMAKLVNSKEESLYLVSANSDALKVFLNNKTKTKKVVSTKGDETYVFLKNKMGEKRKQELYYGSTYLSQSTRSLSIDSTIEAIEIFNTKGESRKIKF